MAITTYAELQAAAANWLVRADLGARVPEFIALAEARLNRVLRLRRGEVEVSLTGTPGSATVALPAGYTEALAVWILLSGSSQRTELQPTDPALLAPSTVNSQPFYWVIDGANLKFDCPLDQAYQIYMRCIEAFVLSDAAPTNSLLDTAPDAYLFATLCEAAPFLRDDALTQAYEAKLARAISELNAKESRSRAQAQLPTEPGQLQRLGQRQAGWSIYSDR